MGNHSAQPGSHCPVLGNKGKRVFLFTRSYKATPEREGAKRGPSWGLRNQRCPNYFETAIDGSPAVFRVGGLEEPCGAGDPLPFASLPSWP